MMIPDEGSESVGFNPGEVIIEHVANSSLDHPIFELPTVLGINFSVTKHVLMLWIVAVLLFVLITWSTRKYLKQDRPIPTGFMNALEAVVQFISD
jgi:F-type H+-transporting ATPase subunit a